jgi:apolipoprotein N-acyltransferase
MAPVYLWPLTLIGYALFGRTLFKVNTLKQSAITTFLFFLGFHICGLYWVSASLFVDFSTWWWALPFSFMGLPFLCAIFPTILVLPVIFIPKYKLIYIAVALGLADIARGMLFTGFPWNYPIHGFVNTDLITLSLPYIGFYALNSLIIFTAIAAGAFYIHSRAPIIIAAIAAIYFVPFGQKDALSLPPKNTVLIQANIAQQDKWNPDLMVKNLDQYIAQSNTAITNNGPYIIIWPETAISQNLLSYPDAMGSMVTFLGNLPDDSLLITGFLNASAGQHYNSLIVFDTDGGIIARYDKHHLVPFGEYMPLGLSTITGFDGFTSGTPPEKIQTDLISFLPLICYEIIFPHYSANVNEFDFILNITNDAWFGNTAGPYQHFDHARWRAIETKQPVLRVSGNGISGWIYSNGYTATLSSLNSVDILKY